MTTIKHESFADEIDHKICNKLKIQLNIKNEVRNEYFIV